ncbi:hypothetical protein D3C87_1748190 [compost metagenome]
MPAGEHHHRQLQQADQQPRTLSFRRQRHAATKQPPGHQGDTQRQAKRGLPAKTLHIGLGSLLLALAAFGFVLDHFCAVTGFLDRRDQRLWIGAAGDQRAAFRQIDARLIYTGYAL